MLIFDFPEPHSTSESKGEAGGVQGAQPDSACLGNVSVRLHQSAQHAAFDWGLSSQAADTKQITGSQAQVQYSISCALVSETMSEIQPL